MESSLQGKVIRQLIAHASSDLLIGEKIRNGELRKKLVTIEPRWRCPEGFTHTEITMDDFKMEWLEAEENKKDRVILQLHGGGYIAGMRNAYRTFALVYSELGGNINVLTPDYRCLVHFRQSGENISSKDNENIIPKLQASQQYIEGTEKIIRASDFPQKEHLVNVLNYRVSVITNWHLSHTPFVTLLTLVGKHKSLGITKKQIWRALTHHHS